MPSTAAKQLITDLAARAGITINGGRPHDITVHDERFFARVARDGSLGLGESYMEGWWDAANLAELHHRIASGRVAARLRGDLSLLFQALRAHLLNLQSPSRAHVVARDHYDLTDQAYRCMTDTWVTLSCGYWRDAATLQEAQEAKLDLICRKLELRPSQRVLDIGCGFGSFARFAADRHGCTVVGINISARQLDVARELAGDLPVEFVLCDYRDAPARFGADCFDHVVSAGMFEHVGHRNFGAYMKAARRVLKPGGLFLLHTVGSNVSVRRNDRWFDRYIFPNGMLPSIAQIGRAIEGLFTMEDWHNFGHDYSRTLAAWYEQFERSWPGPRDDSFYRMWKYYLLCSAGQFSSRRVQLWQLVLAREGVRGGYRSIR